jgi:hypothetical protein
VRNPREREEGNREGRRERAGEIRAPAIHREGGRKVQKENEGGSGASRTVLQKVLLPSSRRG